MKIKHLMHIFTALLVCAGTSFAQQQQPRQGRLYFAIGNAWLNIDNLNSKLENAGYNKLSNTFNTFGLGAFVSLPNRLLLGVEGYGMFDKSVTSGAFKTRLMSGAGFFDIGYMAYTNEAVSIYPILGIGGMGHQLEIAETGVSNFNSVLANPRRESLLTAGGFALNLSVGGDVLINFAKNQSRKQGLALGIRAGYIYMPWDVDWELAENTLSNSPSSSLSGFYINFTIGFGGVRPYAGR